MAEKINKTYLFVRIDINMALNAFLSHVSPWISRHPLAFAFWTLVFTKASFASLIRSFSFTFRTGLKIVIILFSTILNQMAKKQLTYIIEIPKNAFWNKNININKVFYILLPCIQLLEIIDISLTYITGSIVIYAEFHYILFLIWKILISN